MEPSNESAVWVGDATAGWRTRFGQRIFCASSHVVDRYGYIVTRRRHWLESMSNSIWLFMPRLERCQRLHMTRTDSAVRALIP
jgi:hypothetical protein